MIRIQYSRSSLGFRWHSSSHVLPALLTSWKRRRVFFLRNCSSFLSVASFSRSLASIAAALESCRIGALWVGGRVVEEAIVGGGGGGGAAEEEEAIVGEDQCRRGD